MTPDEIHAILLQECERLGWPRLWKTDLVHDQRILYVHQPPCFVYHIREAGTDMLYSAGGLNWLKAMADPKSTAYLGDAVHYYWWNGETLTKMTGAEAIQKLRIYLGGLAHCQHPPEYWYGWWSHDGKEEGTRVHVVACRHCHELLPPYEPAGATIEYVEVIG